MMDEIYTLFCQKRVEEELMMLLYFCWEKGLKKNHNIDVHCHRDSLILRRQARSGGGSRKPQPATKNLRTLALAINEC